MRRYHVVLLTLRSLMLPSSLFAALAHMRVLKYFHTLRCVAQDLTLTWPLHESVRRHPTHGPLLAFLFIAYSPDLDIALPRHSASVRCQSRSRCSTAHSVSSSSSTSASIFLASIISVCVINGSDIRRVPFAWPKLAPRRLPVVSAVCAFHQSFEVHFD